MRVRFLGNSTLATRYGRLAGWLIANQGAGYFVLVRSLQISRLLALKARQTFIKSSRQTNWIGSSAPLDSDQWKEILKVFPLDRASVALDQDTTPLSQQHSTLSCLSRVYVSLYLCCLAIFECTKSFSGLETRLVSQCCVVSFSSPLLLDRRSRFECECLWFWCECVCGVGMLDRPLLHLNACYSARRLYKSSWFQWMRERGKREKNGVQFPWIRRCLLADWVREIESLSCVVVVVVQHQATCSSLVLPVAFLSISLMEFSSSENIRIMPWLISSMNCCCCILK